MKEFVKIYFYRGKYEKVYKNKKKFKNKKKDRKENIQIAIKQIDFLFLLK